MVFLDVSFKFPRLYARHFILTIWGDSNLPVGAVVIIGLSFFLRIKSIDTPARKLPFRQKLERLDPVGCLVFLSAVCCLLLALQWGGQEKAWDSADVLGCLVGAFALGILFIVTQWYQKEQALIPLRIFAKRSIWTGVMVLFFIGAETSIVSSSDPKQ